MPRLTAVACLLLLVAVVAGTTSSSFAGSRADVQQLTLWHGFDRGEAAELNKLVAQFNKTHPTIHVNAVFDGGNDTSLQKVLAALAGGKAPDIAYMYGSDLPNIAKSPKVVTLDDLVHQKSFNWNDFWPGERKAATVGGHVKGIPALVDNLALVYNKKLFDQAHMPYPTASWTWDDFRAAAKKLTNKSKGVYGYAIPADASEDTVWHYEALLWEAGGDIISADYKHAVFNSPAGVKALTYLTDMSVKDHSMYLDTTDQKYPALFWSGRIAMLTTGPWDLPDIRAHKVPFGVTVMPAIKNHQTIAGPDDWVVFDHGSDAKAAAYTFLTWLTAPQQVLAEDLATAHLPIRQSVMSLPGFAQIDKRYPGNGVFMQNLKNAVKARPPIPQYTDLSRALGQAVVAALLGKKDPKSALDQAAKDADGALSS
jgi:multiple sugar transport system substrate-binding protein